MKGLNYVTYLRLYDVATVQINPCTSTTTTTASATTTITATATTSAATTTTAATATITTTTTKPIISSLILIFAELDIKCTSLCQFYSSTALVYIEVQHTGLSLFLLHYCP